LSIAGDDANRFIITTLPPLKDANPSSVVITLEAVIELNSRSRFGRAQEVAGDIEFEPYQVLVGVGDFRLANGGRAAS
jgi:hypothetical protein